jgi:hypothetical protein
MSSRRRYPGEPRCLRVVPRTRGDWIVMTEQQVAISEHASVTEAGHAVVARLGRAMSWLSMTATTAPVEFIEQSTARTAPHPKRSVSPLSLLDGTVAPAIAGGRLPPVARRPWDGQRASVDVSYLQ